MDKNPKNMGKDMDSEQNLAREEYIGKCGLPITPAEIFALLIGLIVFSLQLSFNGILFVLLCSIAFVALHRSQRMVPKIHIEGDVISYEIGQVRQTVSTSQVLAVKSVGNWFVGKSVEVQGIIHIEIAGTVKPVRKKMVIQDVFDIDAKCMAETIWRHVVAASNQDAI